MELTRQRRTTVKRVVAYWVTGIGFTSIFLLFHGVEWQGNAELHTVFEVLTAFLAAMVGMMALFRYYSRKDHVFLFVGAGFLGVVFLDGYHAIITSAYVNSAMPSDLPSLTSWSWIASRQFLALMMFLGWVESWRQKRFGAARRLDGVFVYSFTALFILAGSLLIAFVPMPRGYYAELPLYRPEEFGPALFFLLALVGYLREGAWRRDPFEHWLVLSLTIGLIGQAVFMSHSERLFDIEFAVAHLLKVASYVCVMIGLAIDMYPNLLSAHKHATKARTVIEAMVDGYITIDASGEIVSVDGTAEAIFGYSEKELIGENVAILMPTPYRDEHDAYVKAFLRTGISRLTRSGREVVGRRQDGTEFPLEIRVAELLVDGDERGFVGMVRDITRLKEKERALDDVQGRFKDFAEVTSDWFWETDQNMRFRFLSDSFEAVSEGLRPEGIIGKTHRDLGWADTDEKKWLKVSADIKARKPIEDFQYLFITPKGNERLWWISCRPIFDANGGFRGYRGVGRDITEHQKAETELRSYRGHLNEMVTERTAALEGQARELEQNLLEVQAHNTLQREFVAMVSHKFRTPLAIIDAAAQRILRRKEPLSPEELVPRIAKIRNAVQRMNDLIESVLSSARLEAGKIEKKEQVIDLADLLKEICLYQQEISRSHALAVDVDRIDAPIRGDPKLLDHVFNNLVSNAIKYSPNAPKIEVRGWIEDGEAVVSIRDYGLGIPDDEIPKLFERYYRATTSTGIAGSGIGLSLVKELVQLHDGRIDVKSAKGEGSTFTVRLPVQSVTRTERNRAPEPPDGEIDTPKERQSVAVG